ncbi:MAG TPA: hypothetical protein PLS55_08495, partial [Thermogutta sp.]|nr:hypothetical protein [Thermogutta sp.]
MSTQTLFRKGAMAALLATGFALGFLANYLWVTGHAAEQTGQTPATGEVKRVMRVGQVIGLR